MSVESSGGRAQGRRDRQGPGAPARPTRDAAAAELTRLLTPAVAAAGFDLEEVDVRPAGGGGWSGSSWTVTAGSGWTTSPG